MNSKEVSGAVQKWLYKHSNIYQSCNYSKFYHEADVLGITKSLVVTEVEVKISRSDFKADFKKTNKHFRLENAICKTFWHIPNKFYYACPACMVYEHEVPKYAGLLWVDDLGNIELKKKAPIIHKEKPNTKVLLGMLTNHTEKSIFGCAYMTYKNRNKDN